MEGDQEDEETKICSNCKRDIPRVNFLVHTVHCARNIRTCTTCKEPVPLLELEEHHDRLHKLQPCKACGESVCGSDLEDHVRDSCANTVRPCRFCELELPRRKLPPHESYCGSRTEQCPDCREWVQIKYRQLHLDSNHGFIKLDDEPPPIPQLPWPTSAHLRPAASTSNWSNVTQPIRTTVMRPTPTAQLPTNGSTTDDLINAMKEMNAPRTNEKYLKPVPNTPTSNEVRSTNSASISSNDAPSSSNGTQRNTCTPNGSSNEVQRTEDHSNSERNVYPRRSNSSVANNVPSHGRSDIGVRPKRTNDRPQVNTSVAGANKVSKMVAGGAPKKRLAPQPPAPCPQRDSALRSALTRHAEEDAARQRQNAINAAMGLPPVLSAAEKLERLRKMDALHNRESQEPDYKNRLRGQCWLRTDFVDPGQVLGHGEGSNSRFLEPGQRLGNSSGETGNDASQTQVNQVSMDQVEDPSAYPLRSYYPSERSADLKNLKPMSQAEFLDRYQEIHNGRTGGSERSGGSGRSGGSEWIGGSGREDRFSEIKSSLRELRRGLNEVTAPYNAGGNINNNGSSNNNNNPSRRLTPSPRALTPPPAPDGEVQLPCEFCGVLVSPEELVLHQTGCRPDLVAYSPQPSPGRSPSPRRSPQPPAHAETVIPCEFCAESLPVYLLNEHQERCRRENELLYPD